MTKINFIKKHLSYSPATKSYFLDLRYRFAFDKVVVEDMNDDQFREIAFFELRKGRQAMINEIDKLTKELIKYRKNNNE